MAYISKMKIGKTECKCVKRKKKSEMKGKNISIILYFLTSSFFNGNSGLLLIDYIVLHYIVLDQGHPLSLS